LSEKILAEKIFAEKIFEEKIFAEKIFAEKSFCGKKFFAEKISAERTRFNYCNCFRCQKIPIRATDDFERVRLMAVFGWAHDDVHSYVATQSLNLPGRQGCQIFLDRVNQNGGKYIKLPQYYQMTIKYYQTTVRYSK
jgi:hypothetical protein